MKVIPENCRSNLLNLSIPYEGYSRNLSFQSFEFEHTLWRLFQKPVVPIFWIWTYLMKVIPETCRSNLLNLSIPYEGYSRNLSFQSFEFEHTLWRLFQKPVVPIFWIWTYLMKVIPETCHSNPQENHQHMRLSYLKYKLVIPRVFSVFWSLP